ncbi:hypothetical protein [Hyphomicrobium sp.]|uniref:hypothetical protein n=1 Tax=Hyphomicrobium sp. TaxID=82 RepID=UPI001E0B3678|nr:hypothetical protein [Hyphomicrobium sp.]MBY0559854.1 hypothetical protein [Hyphomicrobium sp.]
MSVRNGGGRLQWPEPRKASPEYQRLSRTDEDHLVDTMNRVAVLETDHVELKSRVEDLEQIRETATDAVKWLWNEVLRFVLGVLFIWLLVRFGKMTAEQAAEFVKAILSGG